jgi:hypothetical protein
MSTRALLDACWDGYRKRGMKRKGGKLVPNCVKEQQRLSDWIALEPASVSPVTEEFDVDALIEALGAPSVDRDERVIGIRGEDKFTGRKTYFQRGQRTANITWDNGAKVTVSMMRGAGTAKRVMVPPHKEGDRWLPRETRVKLADLQAELDRFEPGLSSWLSFQESYDPYDLTRGRTGPTGNYGYGTSHGKPFIGSYRSRPLSDLPNEVGFKFYGLDVDGISRRCIVAKTGELHCVSVEDGTDPQRIVSWRLTESDKNADGVHKKLANLKKRPPRQRADSSAIDQHAESIEAHATELARTLRGLDEEVSTSTAQIDATGVYARAVQACRGNQQAIGSIDRIIHRMGQLVATDADVDLETSPWFMPWTLGTLGLKSFVKVAQNGGWAAYGLPHSPGQLVQLLHAQLTKFNLRMESTEPAESEVTG